MSVSFSLIGNADGLDVLLIPRVDKIINFAKGDFQIADNLKKQAMIKTIGSAPVEEKNLALFLKSAGLKTKNPDLHSYYASGAASIAFDDIELENSNTGLNPLEKSIFKSIFETQKPYLEVAMVMVECLADIEDVIARLLAFATDSQVPITYPKALSYKLFGAKIDLNKVKNLSKKDKNPNLNSSASFDPTKNTKGINNPGTTTQGNGSLPSGYHYEVESIEYSTGVKVDGVKYKEIYHDIPDDSLKDSDLDGSSSDGSVIPETDGKPTQIVFGYFDSSGNVLSAPDWLKNSGKWFGQFDQVTNPSAQASGYRLYNQHYIEAEVLKNTGASNPSMVNDIMSKIDFEDVLNKSNEEPFLKKKNKLVEKAFLPREFTFNNKTIFVDPENEYNLTLVRVSPAYNTNEDVLKTTNPYGTDINRNKTSVYDNEDYYIVEGTIIPDENAAALNGGGAPPSGARYYGKTDFFKAIKVFIKALVKIFTKLIPLAQQLIALFTDPFKFLYNIIGQKLGEHYEFLSAAFVSEVKKLENISPALRHSHVENNSMLKKYIYVDTNGGYKFVLDGFGGIELFGYNLGIEIEKAFPAFIKTGDFSKFQNNSMFKFIFGIVAIPIKIVKSIVEYILGVFTSLSFSNVKDKITDFITFKWFRDLTSPATILRLAGLKINPSLLTEWLNDGKSSGTYPMSEFLSLPLIFDLPTVNKSQLMIVKNKPFLFVTQIFKFLEQIIDTFICFIFSILNVGKVLGGCPKVNLSRFTDSNLSANDISNILAKDGGASTGPIDLYRIIFENGTILDDLNKAEVQNYVNDNPNVKFTYKL